MSDIFGPGPDDPEDVPVDRFGVPSDYDEFMWDDPSDESFWRPDEPSPNWWDTGVELQNDSGDTFTLPASDWYALTTADPMLVEQQYGMDPLDIIFQLQDDYGLWDSDDWETWRNQYELTAG